ncbi:MAG: hypothetical protein ACI9FB_001725 [Candidatus Azotimanducaceae bacterium]
MLLKILKNAHIRLLFTGSFFAAAFVAMAIYSYGVDVEEIKVFLVFSFLFLLAIMVAGFLFSFVISIYRRLMRSRNSGGLLDNIEKNKIEDIAVIEDEIRSEVSPEDNK